MLFENILYALCITLLLTFTMIFKLKRRALKETITKLYGLEEYFDSPETRKMEKRIKIIANVLFVYIILSCTVHVAFPFFNLKSCEEEKKHAVYTKEIPCGVIFPIRFPFDYNHSPAYELVIIYIGLSVYAFPSVIANTLLLNFSLALHTIGHLRNYKNIVSEAVSTQNEDLMKRCIDYHDAIIR